MSVLVNKNSKVIVQGFTGSEGSFHAQQMIEYGTNVVGGVTPGKGGSSHLERPVFNSVEEAVQKTGADVSIIFVPPAFAADAIMEAADAGIKVIITITEGIPVKDIIGESLGFRRPGYIVSAEPGVTYMKGKTTYNLNVPIAMYRMRSQSVTDKQVQDASGIARNGDAAFADYLISFGVTYRLSAQKAKGILIH